MEALRQEQLRQQLYAETRLRAEQAERANYYNHLYHAPTGGSTRRVVGHHEMSPEMAAQNQPRLMGYYMPFLQNQPIYAEQVYESTQPHGADQSHYTEQVYQTTQTQPAHQYAQYGQSQQPAQQFQPGLTRGQQQRPASWHPSTNLPSPPVDFEYAQVASPQWPSLATQYGQQENYQQGQQENYQQGYQQSYQPAYTSRPLQQESYQPGYAPRSPQFPAYSAPAAPSPEFSPPSPMMRHVSANQSPLAMQQGQQESNQQSYRPDYTPRSPQLPHFFAEAPPSPEFSPPSPMMRDGSMDWSPLAMSQRSTSVDTNPPTPSGFSTYPSQLAVPEPAFQVVDEPEEEGEVLVGLGLYDTPGKYVEDSSYTFRGFSELGTPMLPREPTGKRLKLAEGWVPPSPPDDEDEDDEEEEEEEEDEDEE
ncbi:hypothetical protein J3F83DRAFT_454429 [Trichoderma novae-zelandiae]